MKYVLYRWAKPTNRFEPRPHWALLNPNFYGIIVPEAYHRVVYAGMDPLLQAISLDYLPVSSGLLPQCPIAHHTVSTPDTAITDLRLHVLKRFDSQHGRSLER